MVGTTFNHAVNASRRTCDSTASSRLRCELGTRGHTSFLNLPHMHVPEGLADGLQVEALLRKTLRVPANLPGIQSCAPTMVGGRLAHCSKTANCGKSTFDPMSEREGRVLTPLT